MTDQREQTPGAVGSKADWIKAAILVTAIVGVLILLFMLGIGQFCDCTTRPPA
jgi:hypothetical protein